MGGAQITTSVSVLINAVAFGVILSPTTSKMEEYKVVPGIIPEVPTKALNITYGEINVTPGLELTPTQVQNQPSVSWVAEKDTYYTLRFTDPDVPPAFNFTEFAHWLVVDIPENDVNAGTAVFDYIGSGPPQGSGVHRYIFILYKQQGKLSSEVVASIKDENLMDRGKFSFSEFQEANNVTGPIAANFYRAQYDDHVPKLMAKLQERYGPLNV